MKIIKFYDPRHNGEGLVCFLDCPLHLCQISIYLILAITKKSVLEKNVYLGC